MLGELRPTMSTSVVTNVTTSVITTPPATAPNYWPVFGPLQYFEVVYLTIIVVLGTIGNLIVIFSISLERRVHLHGNIFIINLAVADLLVSGFIVPTIIANVVNKRNALSVVLCDVTAFLVTVTCTCSLCNLMFIALNRFWAVAKSSKYQKVFSRRRVYMMVAFTWLWSSLLVVPTLIGWGGLRYDGKIMICSWDDVKDTSYTYFITIIAVFVPLLIIAICYFKLFSTVRGSGKWVRSLSVGSGISSNSEQNRRSMRKERSLLRTLLTTVLLFCVCWVPFGACVLINPAGTPAHAKKVFGWLAVTNSCVNFIIYGTMNPVFRRGYHNLFIFIFRCKRVRRMGSTMVHGSFSDSYNRSAKRATKGNQPDPKGKGEKSRSKSENNRENSKADTITAVPPAVSTVTQTTMHDGSPLLLRTPGKAPTKEPSPLAAPRNNAHLTVPATTNSSKPMQKKGIVESIKKVSLRRKGRARSNTADDTMSKEERERKAKRNSAMLLQLQTGDEGSSSDEFERNQEERFCRRSQSDISPSTNGRTQLNRMKCREYGKCNGAAAFNVDEISKGPLRGNWMPEKTVYTSRGNTPILGVSSTRRLQGKPNGTSSSKLAPAMRKEIVTVSGDIDDRSDAMSKEKKFLGEDVSQDNQDILPKSSGPDDNSKVESSILDSVTPDFTFESSYSFEESPTGNVTVAPHEQLTSRIGADSAAPTSDQEISSPTDNTVQQRLNGGLGPELAMQEDEEKR